MGREQFTFYRSFYRAVRKLPKQQRLGLLMAVIEYALDMVEPVGLTDQQEGQFELIKPVLKSAWRKAKAGAIGGKISKPPNAKSRSKGEIEIENETDKEIEIESESKGQGFPRFWERYPVKLGREEAQAQWESVCTEFDFDDILSGLENWMGSEEWKREKGRFIPKPEKWLKERWWLQNPRQAVPYGASGQLGKAEREAIQRMLER